MRSNNILILVLVFASITGCRVSSNEPVTLVSITVTPANPSFALGTTAHVIATGTYSNSATLDLTATATWSTSSASVATVSNAAGSNGLVTPVALGTTTITAVSGGLSASTTLTVTPTGGSSGDNMLQITVNGSLCSANSYPNKPCVSVTVCSPGTATCQTINDILLDTGSYGLRIFKQALSVSLTQLSTASGSIAECVQYGDGSSNWGPVQEAGVILGNEPVVQIPIQVIDATFGSIPSGCGTPDTSPSSAGFNGILGAGLFLQDCGAACVNLVNNGMYYACTGTTCSGSIVSLTSQVLNPIAFLPEDNNGVIVSLPSVSSGGVSFVTGTLYLGINASTILSSSGSGTVTVYHTNQYGEFTTKYKGYTYSQSFIDSGSNGLYFPPTGSTLTICASPFSSFYCETPISSETATTQGYTGSPSSSVAFQIGDFSSLYTSYISGNKNVFVEMGGSMPGSSFDWGLPFYLGKNVYVGFEGNSSSLGSGTYWAY